MSTQNQIQELSNIEIEHVNGGIAPILGGLVWGLGYIGALQVAADFGRGLGSGLYDAIHYR